MKIELVLFDFDGTLVESAPGITEALSYAFKQMGIEETKEENLLRFIGPPLNKGFQEWYGMDPKQCKEMLMHFRERYDAIVEEKTTCYTGVKEALETLKQNNIPMCIASAKPKFYLDRLCDNLQIGSYFEHIQGPTLEEENGHAQNNDCKSRMIQNVLEAYPTIPRDHIVMIGDKASDILAAKAHGLQSIGVLYGYGSLEELSAAKPDYFVHTIQECIDLLGQ